MPDTYWKQVSESLDALGMTVGSILVRTPDGWMAIPPGEPGQVLISQGENETPEWGDF